MQLNPRVSSTPAFPQGINHGSFDRRIRAFLCGKTHGEDVLATLYGDVGDEPIPERLRAILNR